ncbi:MAG: hypothetical protein HQ565_09480 [Bacteroidetes bacterium]|nr:hypothetical protein [Bacteroidota bacterium]
MEFTRENKIEALADLNRIFAVHLNIDDILPDEKREGILKLIQQTDEEIFSILASFNNDWLAWDYVKSDTELRIKVEDVWKMEVERHHAAFEISKKAVVDLARDRNIDLEPVMLRIKWL